MPEAFTKELEERVDRVPSVPWEMRSTARIWQPGCSTASSANCCSKASSMPTRTPPPRMGAESPAERILARIPCDQKAPCVSRSLHDGTSASSATCTKDTLAREGDTQSPSLPADGRVFLILVETILVMLQLRSPTSVRTRRTDKKGANFSWSMLSMTDRSGGR
jgi:hypothetical protein